MRPEDIKDPAMRERAIRAGFFAKPGRPRKERARVAARPPAVLLPDAAALLAWSNSALPGELFERLRTVDNELEAGRAAVGSMTEARAEVTAARLGHLEYERGVIRAKLAFHQAWDALRSEVEENADA